MRVWRCPDEGCNLTWTLVVNVHEPLFFSWSVSNWMVSNFQMSALVAVHTGTEHRQALRRLVISVEDARRT